MGKTEVKQSGKRAETRRNLQENGTGATQKQQQIADRQTRYKSGWWFGTAVAQNPTSGQSFMQMFE